MVKPIIRKTFIAVALLLAQQAHAAPVRDQQWSLLANQLFPALMDMGTARINPPVLAERRTRLDACKQEAVCVVNAGLWTDAEIESFATAAGKAPASAWRKASMADDGVKTQVVRELRGLNSILQVYGLGNAPRYPLIDGPLDAAGSPRFVATVNEAV
jgi:hypothetical protein